jgi:hypothetical protein
MLMPAIANRLPRCPVCLIFIELAGFDGGDRITLATASP